MAGAHTHTHSRTSTQTQSQKHMHRHTHTHTQTSAQTTGMGRTGAGGGSDLDSEDLDEIAEHVVILFGSLTYFCRLCYSYDSGLQGEFCFTHIDLIPSSTHTPGEAAPDKKRYLGFA